MDDTNEDSWLYGTSNPDSTTNETQVEDGKEKVNAAGSSTENLVSLKTEAENEAQALAAVQNASSDLMVETKKEQEDIEENYGDVYEDPAHEMEEDEEATAAADTTEIEADADAGEDDGTGGVAGEGEQQAKANSGSDDDDDDDSDDDDINVVIGDIKSAPSTYNIKQRGNLLSAGQAAGQEKSKTVSQGGKFSIEDFEGVGTINGVAAHEFSIDSLEDKPWRKPGADITDYFNYGFNEETWRAYCERQKRFRLTESGVGLASLTQNLNQGGERHGEHGGLLPPPPQGNMMPPGAMMHDPLHGGSSTSMMPPPPMGAHGHHGGPMQRMPMRPRQINNLGITGGNTSKENAIQVMTAECREYSRPGQMANNFSGPPPPNDEPFPIFPEADAFDYGYEPTQESQWGNNDNSGWVPTGIKELTPGPALVPPPQMAGPPGPMPPGPQMTGPPPIRGPPPPMMVNMPPNMGMGPPPHVMMMGPVGGPMNMPPMSGPPRMMPPQLSGPPQMAPSNKNHPDERPRSPNRRNRSRSPHRSSRRRSKSPSTRQRRSRSRSKSRKPRSSSRRSASKSRSGRSSRRSRSRSGSKSRKSTRTQRSPSESKSRSKRSRKSHSRSRSKSPKNSSSSSSSKKRTEKIEK